MLITKIIIDGLSNFSHIAYMLKSEHSAKTKTMLIFYWLKIHSKFILSLFFKIKKESLFSYTINFYDYTDFRFLFEEIFYKNEYYLKTTNQTPVIFDCGANIGVATLYFKWLYPNAKVFSFEPNPKTFELLQKNVQQNNLSEVELFNYALTDTNGTMDFFIDKHNPGSLLMSSNQSRIPQNKIAHKITVPTMSLAAFIKAKNIQQIDFLKMDIEGGEKKVVDDLVKNKNLAIIKRLAIEYHHKIDNIRSSGLGGFLNIFEKHNFEYQLDTRCIPTHAEDIFQDVLIFFYKPE